MVLTYIIFYVLLGIILSEYIQLISDRGTFWGSILGRSKCDKCNKEIPWYALIPLIGAFVTKRKCVYCKSEIPLKYFIFELLFTVYWGLIIGFAYWNFIFTLPNMLILLLLSCITALLCYEDFKNFSVPVSWLVTWCLIFSITWFYLSNHNVYILDTVGMLVVLAIAVISVKILKNDKNLKFENMFGLADLIVLVVTTLLLGFNIVTGIFMFTILTSLVYLIIQKRFNSGERLPLLTMMLPWVPLALIAFV